MPGIHSHQAWTWASRRVRRCVGLVCLAASGLSAGPATASDAQKQAWPEVQLRIGMAEHVDVTVLGQRKIDWPSGDTSNAQIGFLVTGHPDPMFSLGAGYRYGREPGDEDSTEHRVLLEQTIRIGLPWDLKLAFRTREEFRWLDDGLSVRLRERGKLQRAIPIGTWHFTPYGSAEFFLDTRYDGISRGRFALGVEFPIMEHLSVDIYAMRQQDWQPSNKKTNILGLILTLSF
jgi:hypothetical protein